MDLQKLTQLAKTNPNAATAFLKKGVVSKPQLQTVKTKPSVLKEKEPKRTLKLNDRVFTENQLDTIVRALVDKEVKKIPKPKDGKTPTKEEIKSIIQPLIPVIRQPKDGKDGEVTQKQLDSISNKILKEIAVNPDVTDSIVKAFRSNKIKAEDISGFSELKARVEKLAENQKWINRPMGGGYTDADVRRVIAADGGLGGTVDNLTDIGDVDETDTPTDGQVVTWNAGKSKFDFQTPADSGDMLKSTYDTDNDGVVEQADTITSQGALATLNTVGTAQIDNDAVTFDKIQNVNTNKLIGRDTAGTGSVEEISVGAGLEFSGASAIQVTNYNNLLASGDNVSALTNDAGYLTSYTETDPVVGAVNGLVKANGAGTISAAVADTDYLTPGTAASTYQPAGTYPDITSGAGAPASTPSKVGDIYIDTTGDDAYIAVGTASSADWEKSNDGGGGGISDGDKGDITVSSSGAVWTIDNSVVTYAKMQNVSATDRLLGRDTAGAGVVEELTPAAVRTMLNVEDGATADQTDAEIETAYNNQVPQVTGLEITAGTETAIRRFSPADIKSMLDSFDDVGYAPGGTDVAVADGGTGASTAADARTNLGLAIGTDVQAHSAVLDATTASYTTSDAADVAANTTYRGVGHLPLAGGTMTGNIEGKAISAAPSTNAFGTSSIYTAFVLGNLTGATAANGGLYAIARHNKSNEPFTALSGWDSGSARTIYLGGGGWSVPDATALQFYTAPAYSETNNTGVLRMTIDSAGKVRVHNDLQVDNGASFSGVLSYTSARGKVTAGGSLGATETINFNSETNYTGTLDSNITFTFANATSGDDVTLYLSYDGTAQRTITWPTVTWLDNATGAAPATPSASGNVLVVTIRYVGTTYYASATGNYAVYA